MQLKGWKHIALNKICNQPISGYSLLGEDRPASHDNGEAGVLKLSCIKDGLFLPENNKFIAEEIHHKLKTPVLSDSIIISRSNTPELVGAVCYAGEEYPHLYLSDLMWQITTKDKSVSTRWLAYLLCSGSIKNKIMARANGTSGSMKKITKGSFLSINIMLPPAPEQIKITEVISTWDRAIEKTLALIAAKEERKKALMRELLTGKRRFVEFKRNAGYRKTSYYSLPEDWQYVPIGKIAKEVSLRNGNSGDLPVLSCTKHQGLVDSLTYFGKQIYSSDTSNYKVVPRKTFAYATNHIEEGSIGYQDLYEKALISPIYTVFMTDTLIDDGFLLKLLKTEWYRHIFEVRTSSSVDRRGSLRWNDFAKIKIPLPSLSEQKIISETVDVLEKEIMLLAKQADALKAQKRGLMQQLLTGKTRVKVDA